MSAVLLTASSFYNETPPVRYNLAMLVILVLVATWVRGDG